MPWSGNKAPDQKGEDGQALALWVEDEFERFANEQIDNLQAVDLRPVFNPPLRPREGMIVYADSSKWNPGYGTGPYYRTASGLWAPLWWGREPLTAARTYYVRTADGNDSNNGLTNSAGGAFKTITKALTVAAGVDSGIYQLTISVQAGTYNEHLILPSTLGGLPPILQGVGNTTVLDWTGSINEGIIENNGVNPWIIKDVKTTGSGGTSYAVTSNFGGLIYLSNVEFATGAPYHMIAQGMGSIKLIANYTISGGATGAHIVGFGGVISTRNIVGTVTGTPAIGTFCNASGPSMIDVFGGSFSGAATGQRYNLTNGASTFGTGGAAGFFPGSIAGASPTGYYG